MKTKRWGDIAKRGCFFGREGKNLHGPPRRKRTPLLFVERKKKKKDFHGEKKGGPADHCGESFPRKNTSPQGTRDVCFLWEKKSVAEKRNL